MVCSYVKLVLIYILTNIIIKFLSNQLRTDKYHVQSEHTTRTSRVIPWMSVCHVSLVSIVTKKQLHPHWNATKAITVPQISLTVYRISISVRTVNNKFRVQGQPTLTSSGHQMSQAVKPVRWVRTVRQEHRTRFRVPWGIIVPRIRTHQLHVRLGRTVQVKNCITVRTALNVTRESMYFFFLKWQIDF